MAVFECDCGARYRFADEHVGKRSKCQNCGISVVLEDTSGPIPIAAGDEVPSGPAAMTQGKIVAPPGSPAAAGVLSIEHGAVHGTIVPFSSYGADVLWTFLFPSSPSSLIIFLVIWGAICVIEWAVSFVCMFVVVWLLFMMWYMAFLMAIVESAAAGDRDLPTVNIDTEILDEIVQPLGRWIASWVFVMAPAATFLVVSFVQDVITIDDVIGVLASGVSGFFQTGGTPLLPFTVLVAVGLFFWPMVLMCVALGGIDSLVRFDLMVVSILRTLPAYGLMLLLMAAAIVLDYYVRSGLSQLVGSAAGGVWTAGAMAGALPLIVGAGFGLYLNIVLMRLIGLYYHHHKKRLAWWWG